MKFYIRYIVLLLICWNTAGGQVMDLVVSSTDTGNKTYQARNSITFANGYSYTPAGGTMTAELVNPFLNGEISYNYNIVDPSSRTLNTSYIVGTPKGVFDVNALGSAAYSIPIDVPPGIGGLQPNLSIVYNSLSGNGNAGYGWNISGLSAITRAGQDYYHDLNTTSVDLTTNDRFYLDGQRLICPNGSGQYGTNGSVYRTENDIFSKVTCYTGTNGPDKFEVKAKDGMTYQYGYNSYADQTIDGIDQTIGWYLNNITDVYGNYIDFIYVKDNGVNYIAEINYGPNNINFYYKQRLDSKTNYLKGKAITQRLLLDRIEIKYNSTLIRKYEFKYNYTLSNYSRYSVLNEVYEYGINSGVMNSIAFKYTGTDNINYEVPSITSSSHLSSGYILYSGDYNGDGKDDIFALSNANLKDWKLYLANTYGTGFNLSSSGSYNYTIENVIASDLNADGKDDLILVDFTISQVTYLWSISSGTSFSAAYWASTESTDMRPYYGEQDYSADFDGDGVNDCLVKRRYQGTYNWDIYSMGHGTLNSSLTRKNWGTLNTWGDSDYSSDFNGDGKSDIWIFDGNGIKIYTVNGNSLTTLYSNTFPSSNHHFKLGDFNGDGKTDLFVYGLSSTDYTEWKTLISNGSGFTTNTFTAHKTNLKDDKVYTGDFNSDGQTDILALSKNTSNNPRQYYLIANINGSDFFSQTTEHTSFNKDNFFLTGDFDGNAKTDILTTVSSGYYLSKLTGNTNNLLSHSADGLNNKTEVIYQRLTDQACGYSKGSPATFPVYNYHGPLTVVKEVKENNAATGYWKYSYTGLKIHRQGKGVLGYQKTGTEDVNAALISEKCNSYHTSLYYPKLDTVYLRTSSQKISTTINTWAYYTTTANVIFPYVSVSEQTDNLKGLTVKNTFYYNNLNGNIEQTETDFKNNYKKTTIYHYDTNATYNWIGGRIDTLTVIYSQTSNPSIVRKTSYTYSTDGKMKPDFEKYLEGTNWYYYKNNDYDSKGNITQTFEYATNGGAGRTTAFTYETNGVRLKTVTDPLLHTTTNNYDTYGRLASEVDYLNNKTGHKYDNVGRVVADTLFDGRIKTYTCSWGIGSFTNSCYNIAAAGNDGSQTITWYDNKGREIRNDVKSFAGSADYIYTVTEYLLNGRLYRVSEPSASASPTYWNVYSYDAYGRTYTIIRPTLRNTLFIYVANKVTETTGGISSWKVTNSMGLVTTAHDNGGDITYTYYPDGAVKTISAGGGTTSMYYDAAGNQTKLVDPSAGTIEYTYDGFSQLSTIKNGRIQTTTNNYHPDGRINTIVAPEGTTTYAYYTNKMVQSVTAPGSVVTYYDYDTKGRVDSICENIAGTAFSTTFTFDNVGRLKTRKHPTGRVETINYNSNGYYLSGTIGSAYYAVTAMNSYGLVTKATYGNGIAGDFGFDTFGTPTYRKVKVGSSTFRQDDRYAFYPVTGNLTSRKDSIVSRIKTETFTYDNLDRLLTVTGPQNLTMQYNSNGNIERKNDLSPGVYAYDPARIYAVKEINSSNLLIPAISQSIATYTSFEQPLTINEGQYSATFTYNHEGQRSKMEVKQNGSTILTRWYAGSRYIKETAGSTTKEYIWLGGDAYSAPALEVKQNGGSTIYQLLRDHLGTITQVTGQTGALYNEYSYDAWGRRRNFTNWTYTIAAQTDFLPGRGFTGHEWLPWFNLYNMNGRLYDPLVGRFLSPDNNVQMPDYTQNFNRYSYCLNNPLRYTDPGGEFIFTLLAAIIPGAQPLLPFAIAADVSWMTDYGMQVAMNYANRQEGWTGKDIWFNKIDWFDVGMSAVIGGATGGFGAELKAGKELGKFGTWVVNNSKLLTAGEMIATSAIDITGEGWQPVNMNDFTKRVGIGLTIYGMNDIVGNYTKKYVKSPTNESNFEEYLNSGSEIDRNGLTRSGRALQKHGSRPNSIFPNVVGKELNIEGQNILNSIVNSPNKSIISNRFGGFDIFDLLTGRGARFGASKNFMGFLEP